MTGAPRDAAADVGAAMRELLSRAARCDLGRTDWRVLAAVVAEVAGWTRLADRVAAAQLARAAGLAGTKTTRQALARLSGLGLIRYEPSRSGLALVGLHARSATDSLVPPVLPTDDAVSVPPVLPTGLRAIDKPLVPPGVPSVGTLGPTTTEKYEKFPPYPPAERGGQVEEEEDRTGQETVERIGRPGAALARLPAQPELPGLDERSPALTRRRRGAMRAQGENPRAVATRQRAAEREAAHQLARKEATARAAALERQAVLEAEAQVACLSPWARSLLERAQSRALERDERKCS